MKKITEERAKLLIAIGKYPKCQVSRDVYKTVISLEELRSLKKLSSVQMFELYEDDTSINLPKNTIEVSIDDAIKLISKNEHIGCIRNNEVQTINTISELMGVVRSCNIRRDNFVLFWLVA